MKNATGKPDSVEEDFLPPFLLVLILLGYAEEK
jgi:hypothetical protein